MSSAATTRQVSLELDVLRGFAAVLMVVNHAGLQWLSARDAQTSISGALVFLGSLAPAVFFFVTGFGTAMSAAARVRPAPWGPLLVRSALLVVADQFFAWTHGTAWVLDFFSFIGLTVLIVGTLSRLQRPSLACGLLVAFLLVARYVVGPVLTRSIDLPRVADWIIGVHAVDNVSYPLSPWLIYPLLGMIAGRWFATASGERALSARRLAVAGAAATVLLGISLWMASHGRDLFRWGTVSASFFVFSLAILLALAIVSAMLATHAPRAAGLVALSGIASFALIPLHYALIGQGSLILTGRLPLDPGTAGVLAVLLLVVCFAASKGFAQAMHASAVEARHQWLYPLLLLVLAILAVFTWTSPAAGPRQALLEAFAGQMVIAALLAMRARRRGPGVPASSSPEPTRGRA